MSTMNDTPRTDAAFNQALQETHPYDFALEFSRTLEREIEHLREEVKNLNTECESQDKIWRHQLSKVKEERDQLRADLTITNSMLDARSNECNQLRAEVERLRDLHGGGGPDFGEYVKRCNERDQWREVATSFDFANQLYNLMLDWQRQDDELASARSGLEAEDRLNESEEDERINKSRKKQVEKLALAAYERLKEGMK